MMSRRFNYSASKNRQLDQVTPAQPGEPANCVPLHDCSRPTNSCPEACPDPRPQLQAFHTFLLSPSRAKEAACTSHRPFPPIKPHTHRAEYDFTTDMGSSLETQGFL